MDSEGDAPPLSKNGSFTDEAKRKKSDARRKKSLHDPSNKRLTSISPALSDSGSENTMSESLTSSLSSMHLSSHNQGQTKEERLKELQEAAEYLKAEHAEMGSDGLLVAGTLYSWTKWAIEKGAYSDEAKCLLTCYRSFESSTHLLLVLKMLVDNVDGTELAKLCTEWMRAWYKEDLDNSENLDMMKEVLMKADSECLSQFKLLLIRVKKELSQQGEDNIMDILHDISSDGTYNNPLSERTNSNMSSSEQVDAFSGTDISETDSSECITVRATNSTGSMNRVSSRHSVGSGLTLARRHSSLRGEVDGMSSEERTVSAPATPNKQSLSFSPADSPNQGNLAPKEEITGAPLRLNIDLDSGSTSDAASSTDSSPRGKGTPKVKKRGLFGLGASNKPKESVANMDVNAIADAMCATDFRAYQSIKATEFLGGAWMRINKTRVAPHVHYLGCVYNQTSLWVGHEILLAAGASQRVKVRIFFINLAARLWKQHNYHRCFAIMGGLNHFSVTRILHDGQKSSSKNAALPDKVKSKLMELETLTSIQSNSAAYRKEIGALSASTTGVVPYLALPLRDLVYTEDGYNTTIAEMINVEKQRMIHNIIQNVLRFQSAPSPDPGTTRESSDFLNALIRKDYKEGLLYDLSQRLRPVKNGAEWESDNLGAEAAERIFLYEFQRVCRKGDTKSVKAQLKEGVVNVNSVNDLGESSLHIACSAGQASVVKLLLDAGADANLPSLSLQTPLHMACESKDFSTVKALINGDVTKVNFAVVDENMKLPTMTHPKMLSYINKEVIGPTLLVWNITEKDGTVYKAGKGAREDQEKVKGLILKCMLRLREEVTILRTMNPMEEEGGENGKSKKRATKKLGKARKKQLDVLMKLTQTIYFVLSHTFISEEQMLSSVRYKRADRHKQEHKFLRQLVRHILKKIAHEEFADVRAITTLERKLKQHFEKSDGHMWGYVGSLASKELAKAM